MELLGIDWEFECILKLYNQMEGWHMLVFYPKGELLGQKVDFDFDNGTFKEIEKNLDIKLALEKVAVNPTGKHEFSSLCVAIPKDKNGFSLKCLQAYDLRKILEVKSGAKE